MIPRFFHCACGDVFRTLDTRTPIGKAFLDYSSRGELVPDEITVKLWMAVIGDMVGLHKFKPDLDSLVLDGIPRNVCQAEIMSDLLDVRKVFHLSCPDREALVSRLMKKQFAAGCKLTKTSLSLYLIFTGPSKFCTSMQPRLPSRLRTTSFQQF
jgi:adenylate kinase